jgi:signal transduction histidine kinase
MPHLALVSGTAHQASGAHVAHDLRNLLSTLALHVETLERLAGTSGAKAAGAAHVLIAKSAALCNAAIDRSRDDNRSRRRGVDAMQLLRQLADLVRPAAPEGLVIDVEDNGPVTVLAESGDLFRIMFNLLNNAVAAARQTARLDRIVLSVVRQGSVAAIRIADNGPGLPAAVRSRLFRAPQNSRSGYGLEIARELAERNGATLALDSTQDGTAFVITLPVVAAMLVDNGPVTRSLGRRVVR